MSLNFNNFLIIISTILVVVGIGKISNYLFNSEKQNEFIILKQNDNVINLVKRGSLSSAGWDLYANEKQEIQPKTRMLISTGYTLEYLSDNYYLRIAPRSSLAVKGIDIGAGVVDGDYRGEIKVLVINNSKQTFEINQEMRIAQIIPEYCGNLKLSILDKNRIIISGDGPIRRIRGKGGFGSTDF